MPLIDYALGLCMAALIFALFIYRVDQPTDDPETEFDQAMARARDRAERMR
jgi:hypothetical protein